MSTTLSMSVIGPASQVTRAVFQRAVFSTRDSSMKKYFKKTDEDALDEMTDCGAFFPDEPCGGDSCYLEGAAFYDEHITNGRLIKGGFLKDAGDIGGGLIGLLISLFLLCAGLIGLCKSLQKIF